MLDLSDRGQPPCHINPFLSYFMGTKVDNLMLHIMNKLYLIEYYLTTDHLQGDKKKSDWSLYIFYAIHRVGIQYHINNSYSKFMPTKNGTKNNNNIATAIIILLRYLFTINSRHVSSCICMFFSLQHQKTCQYIVIATNPFHNNMIIQF